MYGFFDSKSKFTTLFFWNIDLTVLLYQKKSIIDLFISLFFVLFLFLFSFYTSILYTPKCIYNYIYLILIFLACYLANVFYIVTFLIQFSPLQPQKKQLPKKQPRSQTQK